METKFMIVIAAVAVAAVGGIGFANTLTVDSGATNPLGGQDINTVEAPSAKVWEVDYTLGATASGGINVTGLNMTIQNTDGSNAHTYEACAVMSNQTSLDVSDLGCALTGSIATSTNGTAIISFASSLSAELLDNIAIAIEELS